MARDQPLHSAGFHAALLHFYDRSWTGHVPSAPKEVRCPPLNLILFKLADRPNFPLVGHSPTYGGSGSRSPAFQLDVSRGELLFLTLRRFD